MRRPESSEITPETRAFYLQLGLSSTSQESQTKPELPIGSGSPPAQPAGVIYMPGLSSNTRVLGSPK